MALWLRPEALGDKLLLPPKYMCNDLRLQLEWTEMLWSFSHLETGYWHPVSLGHLHRCAVKMANANDQQPLITKNVLYAGEGEIPSFEHGSKATFHFKTFKNDEDKTPIDCSRDLGQPFELLIGKKFKLEVWEELIKTMREKEIARFSCDKSLVGGYAIVSKSLRTVAKKAKGELTEEHNHHEHSCSLSAMKSTGYPDLDDLLVNEQDLIFEIELLKYEKPGEFKKETWQMDADEKLSNVPSLKEAGNKLYQQKRYKEAAEKYAEALGCLEQLCLHEKPGDTPWLNLDRMKIPFLLNYAQCKLFLGDYYEVIEHTTTVLEKDKDNVKALYRRAKAHVKCWNPKEARDDFNRVAVLDPSLTKAVKKELEELERLAKEHDAEDRDRLKTLFK